jgi:N-acetylmuramoyl-L-alanine amidase
MQAPLRVLVGANMPAVLVELGFITNPDQEAQLQSDAHQNNLVQAILDAVIQYRDRGATPAGAPPGTGR